MSEIPTHIWCLSDGQLIRLAMPAAREMWVQVHILWTSTSSSVGKLLGTPLAPASFTQIPPGNWTNQAALLQFVQHTWEGNPVTTEWENVPAKTVQRLCELWMLDRPNVQFLAAIQDRKTEKELIQHAWWRSVPYKIIEGYEDIIDGVKNLWHCILKTRKGWYDGKWQWKISPESDMLQLWEEIGENEVLKKHWLILEKRIEDLEFEVSVIVGIDNFWNVVWFDPIYNIHEDGILKYSICPAPIPPQLKEKILAEAKKIAAWISNGYGKYVGLLTIEIFVTETWEILINEFAPRPHNSGHITLDTHDLSQNHLWLQAVRWERLQSTPKLIRAWMMQNILSQKELARVLEKQDVHHLERWLRFRVYDYEKLNWEPDKTNTDQRKLGHINFTGDVVSLWIDDVQKGRIGLEEFFKRIAWR